MTGPSHNEPLDAQERELARILRALPGGEPPAALDQRILRAAADATAAGSGRRRKRWLAFGGAGWGIGSAAAAVLALGVGWQLLNPVRPTVVESDRAAVPAAADSADAVTVDLGEQAADAAAPAAAPFSPPPPPPPIAGTPARARAPQLESAPAAAAPAAPTVAAQSPAATADVDASSANAAGLASAEAVAPAASAAPEKLAMDEFARQQSAREAEAGAASAQAKSGASPLADRAAPATAARTGAMTPAVWLAQVRSLRDAHRRAEAADSLRRFRQYYPQYAIPADLLPLLRE